MSDASQAALVHALLYQQRAGANPAQQAALAPQEHRAFANSWTQEQPLLAIPSLAAAIPAYTGYKASNEALRNLPQLSPVASMPATFAVKILTDAAQRARARSPASLEEIKQGYAGIIDGLTALASRNAPPNPAAQLNQRAAAAGSLE